MDYKIEKCPFCGGNGEVKSRYSNKCGKWFWFVSCQRCKAQSGLYEGSGPAVDGWNTRTERKVKNEAYSCD